MRVCEPRMVHRRDGAPPTGGDRGLHPTTTRSPHNVEYIAQDAATRGFTPPGTLFAHTAHEPSEVHHGGCQTITGESEASGDESEGIASKRDRER